MCSTGYRRPRVCTYAHACMRGLWHGAQLGGPIPLTRSQHPSLAIIPLGGFLAKDLIKYCYTRNLIPLRTPLPPSLISLPPSLTHPPFPSSPFARPSCRTHRTPGMRDPSRHPLDLRENAWHPAPPPPVPPQRKATACDDICRERESFICEKYPTDCVRVDTGGRFSSSLAAR